MVNSWSVKRNLHRLISRASRAARPPCSHTSKASPIGQIPVDPLPHYGARIELAVNGENDALHHGTAVLHGRRISPPLEDAGKALRPIFPAPEDLLIEVVEPQALLSRHAG